MNLKRWLLWICLAVLFVSQVLLFRANQKLDVAQADAREAHQQMDILQTQLEELKSSSVATLSLDNARLRQENQGLSQKLAKVSGDITLLNKTKQDLAQQLQTARQALKLQSDHLQQLSVDNQQIQAAANVAPPEISPTAARDACLENLRQIDGAKQQWALEYSKDVKDVPTAQDLTPYLKENIFPTCPAGGVYTIGSMSEAPACSVPGHSAQ